MLQAVELPAGVAHLAASLAHVDRDALPLQNKKMKWRILPKYRRKTRNIFSLNWKKNKVYILNWNADLVMFYSFSYAKIKTKRRIFTKIQGETGKII